MTIWTDYGFRDNPYSTKSIPPSAEGVDLLVGREAEMRQLHRLLTSSDTHPTIEGDNGVGKTSLVQVTAYVAKRAAETRRIAQLHLPLDEVFQVTSRIQADQFRRQVCFAVVQGFTTHHDVLKTCGFAVPAMADMKRWINQSMYHIGGISSPFGGATRGTAPSTSAGFSEDGFERAVFGWLRECFPSPQAGAFICVLDNLELLETSASARRFLEELRDTVLTVPGLRWVLCGARGVVRGAVASPRLHGVLGAPLELGAVEPQLVPEVIGRRIDAYAMRSNFFLPVDEIGFAEIYRLLNRNLRDALKLCEAFAFTFDEDDALRPSDTNERMALLRLWLTQQGVSYRKAAREVGDRAWKLFDDLVRREGVCDTTEYAKFRFSSPDLMRTHLRALEKANLVVSVAHPQSGRKRVYQVTAAGWLVEHSRKGRPNMRGGPNDLQPPLATGEGELTLVNDTLALAREATDRAAHTMELKAESNLAAIEERAQSLLLPLLGKAQFESIIENPDHRSELEAMAAELGAIEGYRMLQDIELPPYSRYIKGMAQYLADDTMGALRTLRSAAQDASIRELQLFAIYWVAYLNNAIGNFTEAANVCRAGEETLSERRIERVEFDRMIADSTFFAIAATYSDAKPQDRFDAVARLIHDLEDVADRALRDDADRSAQTSHEVAVTRAELYMWIAYNSDRLFAPFGTDSIAKAHAITCPNESIRADPDYSIRADGTIGVEAVQSRADWQALEGEALSAWATQQAAAIYKWQKWDGFDFALNFGQAECDFVLRTWTADTTDLIEAYREIERKASEQLGMRREQRKSVEFAQLWLISAARLVCLLRHDRGDQVPMAESELRQAQRLVQDKLGDIRGAAQLTIFSALQRRALSMKEFKQEAEELVNQALRAETKPPGGDENDHNDGGNGEVT